MISLRKCLQILSLLCVVGLALWSVGCGGGETPTPADANGAADGEDADAHDDHDDSDAHDDHGEGDDVPETGGDEPEAGSGLNDGGAAFPAPGGTEGEDS